MEELILKKGRLIRQITAFLSEYNQAFQKPVPMKVISSKFAKSMNTVGGFQELIEELRRDGTISVNLTETGARSLSLNNVTYVTVPLQVMGKRGNE